jgi:hypothetical protein
MMEARIPCDRWHTRPFHRQAATISSARQSKAPCCHARPCRRAPPAGRKEPQFPRYRAIASPRRPYGHVSNHYELNQYIAVRRAPRAAARLRAWSIAMASRHPSSSRAAARQARASSAAARSRTDCAQGLMNHHDALSESPSTRGPARAHSPAHSRHAHAHSSSSASGSELPTTSAPKGRFTPTVFTCTPTFARRNARHECRRA